MLETKNNVSVEPVAVKLSIQLETLIGLAIILLIYLIFK